MNLFARKNTRDYTIIIGCGRLGASIANTLSDQEKNVLIIDSDKDSFRKLNPSFGGLMLTGDATDLEILKEAQMEKAELIIAVTDNDSTNIMISQIASELYKKEHIIVRLYDPDRECVFNGSSIDIICPFMLSINEVQQIINNEHLKDEVV